MSKKTKNVFVSHHHKNDSSVDGLTKILSDKNYQIRNSSIRIKESNQNRINQKKVSDRTIERLLRMKMQWAGQVIVIIGKETHTRQWVDWEIQTAHRLGKPIIGVYENGLKDKVELPENLKNYATSIVGWRADSVIDALEGNLSGESRFQHPDGTPSPRTSGGTVLC